jgi:hypothetical protein
MRDSPYEALNAASQEIRLATLLAGSFEDDLHVILSTSPLSKELRYEALSYVWGDPNVTRPITLNGHTFEVTTNLEAAIRHLRFQDRDRVFWIDAISVNQTDNDERDSQVLLMRDIYTHCERCIAWLGEEDDNTKEAISFLKFFAQDKHFHEWDSFSDVKRNVDQLTAEIWIKFFEERPQIFKPILDLMARPWWYRAWTAQECVLPEQVMFTCGHKVFDTRTLILASNHWYSHSTSCCHIALLGLPSPDILDICLDTSQSLERLRSVSRDTRTDTQLLYFLSEIRPRSASDPRDKVYSLLGLENNPNRDAPIIPHYDVDLNSLYSQVVKNSIASTKNLEVLGHALESNLENELPSWVPDWSCPQLGGPYQRNRLLRHDLFNACASHAICWQIYHDRTLQLRGMNYDTIQHIGVVCDTAPANSWLLEAVKWIKERLPSQSSSIEEQILNVLLNDCFLTNDFEADERRATAEDYEVARNWLEWFANDEPFPTDERHDLANHIATSSISQRKFFITSNGSLGLGPPEMQVGDEVWIVHGGRMPLIFRPNEESFRPPNSEADQKCHTFVGDSYIYGIMDGEAAIDLEQNSVDVFLV